MQFVTSTEGDGLYFAIRNLHDYTKQRGTLELRVRVLTFITNYLNQLNTQAMLLAAGAMGLLVSSELTEVAQAERGGLIVNYMYVIFACSCLSSALWVIYTSMNLINLATNALLQATHEVRAPPLVSLRQRADARAQSLTALLSSLHRWGSFSRRRCCSSGWATCV